ncbi:transposase [Labrenzia sp. R4_2]|uniref:IS66 family transposase n=1 Tax=Labrenzia sp. R4_2 TaxID=2821107 RepID=UPI00336A41EA
MHRHWDGLQTFLHDGRAEIDCNSVGNLIRPIALNRKNAFSAGHDEGGRIASHIETAKTNGVEPFAYLKTTLEPSPTAIRKAGSTNSCHTTSRRQTEATWGANFAYRKAEHDAKGNYGDQHGSDGASTAH